MNTRNLVLGATAGLLVAVVGAGVSQAGTTTPPPPASWMTNQCATVKKHGIPVPGATDCWWTGQTTGGPETVYLVTRPLHGLNGLIRQHVLAQCAYYAEPKPDSYASGCWVERKN